MHARLALVKQSILGSSKAEQEKLMKPFVYRPIYAVRKSSKCALLRLFTTSYALPSELASYATAAIVATVSEPKDRVFYFRAFIVAAAAAAVIVFDFMW